jgi:large-conductance mechanosensitive channel
MVGGAVTPYFRRVVQSVPYSYGMNLKRLMSLAVIAFLIFFIVQSPNEAARVVKVTGETMGSWLSEIANSLSRFLSSLV